MGRSLRLRVLWPSKDCLRWSRSTSSSASAILALSASEAHGFGAGGEPARGNCANAKVIGPNPRIPFVPTAISSERSRYSRRCTTSWGMPFRFSAKFADGRRYSRSQKTRAFCAPRATLSASSGPARTCRPVVGNWVDDVGNWVDDVHALLIAGWLLLGSAHCLSA
jgi:hypothetical protein